MSNQLVWVMTREADYEGGNVVGVYASLESAKAVTSTGSYERTSDWEPWLTDRGIWAADTDSVSVSLFIYPFEVQP